MGPFLSQVFNFKFVREKLSVLTEKFHGGLNSTHLFISSIVTVFIITNVNIIVMELGLPIWTSMTAFPQKLFISFFSKMWHDLLGQ